MSRIIKSKIYKPFISLLVALILVFSFQVNKPKAIAPIVLWGAYVVAGVVAEEMVEMGIKYGMKTVAKKKADDLAKTMFDQDYDFDFMKNKPYKNKDGSLTVTPSANDRAKIARKIADDLLESAVADGFSSQRSGDTEPNDIRYTIEPYDTSEMHTNSADFLATMFYTEESPSSSTAKYVNFYSKMTGLKLFGFLSPHDTDNRLVTYNFSDVLRSGTAKFASIYRDQYRDGASMNTSQGETDPATSNAFILYLNAKKAGYKVLQKGGLMFPESIGNVYDAPANMPSTTKLPNYDDLSNKPIIIKNILPASETEGEVEWTEIENNYGDETEIQKQLNLNTDYYLENGNVNNISGSYNTTITNNYYIDNTYPIKKGDVVYPPSVGGDDDTPTGDLPPQAEVIDRTLISYAKQTYDYLGDSIDGAIVSMRDITDDASGLVDYLDTSFRWLPAEWRALFGSAFILGVFAHFMRR